MQVLGVEDVVLLRAVFARGRRVVLFDVESVEEAVDVLHVGYIAADANEGAVVEGAETLDVREACKGAVGGCFWRERLIFCICT